MMASHQERRRPPPRRRSTNRAPIAGDSNNKVAADIVLAATVAASSCDIDHEHVDVDNHGCDSCSSSCHHHQQQQPQRHHHHRLLPCHQCEQRPMRPPVRPVAVDGPRHSVPLSHCLASSAGAAPPQRPRGPRLVSQQQMFLISLVLVALLSCTGKMVIIAVP